MTILDFAPTARVTSGVATIQLHDDLWRVTRADGEVLGYVERSSSPAGSKFHAKRMLPRQRRFIGIGDFWDFEAAMECFRF